MKIIVPTDFTEVADDALRYACEFARPLSAEIILMHVLNSRMTLSDAELLIEKQQSRIQNPSSISHAEILQGDFLSAIPRAAKAYDGALMIMGTHGKKGIQHVIGSYAMKLVHDSSMPVIITQQNMSTNPCPQNILLPLEFGIDVNYPIEFACSIANKFKHGWEQASAKIHVVFTCDSESEITIFQLLLDTKLKNTGIPFELHNGDSHGRDFAQLVCEIAQRLSIDLICLPNLSKEKSIELISSREQKFLTNPALIPVLIFNPNLAMHSSPSIFAF